MTCRHVGCAREATHYRGQLCDSHYRTLPLPGYADALRARAVALRDHDPAAAREVVQRLLGVVA